MSLDKILGIKKSTKKTTEIKLKKPTIVHLDEPEEKLDPNKHALKCSNPKCKYERRVRKKELEEADFSCDKCHSPMKEVKIRKKKEKSPEEDQEDESD
jgi:peptide subunit release factor 1 (eRF1)